MSKRFVVRTDNLRQDPLGRTMTSGRPWPTVKCDCASTASR